MLELKGLTAKAGAFRLRDVDLHVAEGESHAVLGPSGSGKTTLLKAILGVLPPEAGQVWLDGQDATRLPIERRGLGYVPQQLGLFPHLTVRKNIAYSARAKGLSISHVQPIVDKLVEASAIGPLLDRLPHTLSGGERQRVGLVRALAGQPRLVLLDEPFTALDLSLRRELWSLMRELQQRWSLTVLLITHDLGEAHYLADRISILLDGAIAQQGPKEEVYRRPATAEVAKFLGVDNLRPARVLTVQDGFAVVEVGSAQLRAAVGAGKVPVYGHVSIRADDVRLEPVSKGAERSHSNCIRTRVVALLSGSPLSSLELDAGFPLVAGATRGQCEALGLRVGTEVMATIPAEAVHLICPTEG